MARRTRSSNAKAKETRRAILIFAASAVAIATLAITVYLGRSEPVGPDGCRIGERIPAVHTIVVIDQTDRLSGQQIEYVRELVLQEYLRLDRYARFSVVGVTTVEEMAGRRQETGRVRRSSPSFSRCRVQAGSEADWLTQNPRQIAENFRKLVGSAMSEMVNSLDSVLPAENSPIMETIDALGASTGFSSPSIVRRLVIVSDMAQFVPGGVSHYPPPGQRFAFSDKDALVSVADLSGTAVRVHYVTRPTLRSTQNGDHRRFWSKYFEESGATDVQIGWGLSPNGEDTLPRIRDVSQRPAPNTFAVGAPASNNQTAKPSPNQPQPTLRADAAPGPTTPTSPPSAQLPSSSYTVVPFSALTPVLALGRSRIRDEPEVSTRPPLRWTTKGEQLMLIGVVNQSDGYWYLVRLYDGSSGFIRADQTSHPKPSL